MFSVHPERERWWTALDRQYRWKSETYSVLLSNILSLTFRVIKFLWQTSAWWRIFSGLNCVVVWSVVLWRIFYGLCSYVPSYRSGLDFQNSEQYTIGCSLVIAVVLIPCRKQTFIHQYRNDTLGWPWCDLRSSLYYDGPQSTLSST